MSAQRFVPFLIILGILGAVAFVLIGTDEAQEGGEVINPVSIGACDQCIKMREDMDALIKKSASTVADWENLRGKVNSSDIEESQRETMLKDWASRAFQDWDNRFNRWTDGAPKPSDHQEEIKALKATLSQADQLNSARLKALSEHSQAFKNFNWLTRTDFASNFESRRTALRKGAFNEEKYFGLDDKITEVCSSFLGRPEVTKAKTTLLNQRACHWQMHNHYNTLVSTRKVRTDLGHSDYSPSSSIRRIDLFQHGQDTYVASEFTYYYNQGKLPEWENPVWY